MKVEVSNKVAEKCMKERSTSAIKPSLLREAHHFTHRNSHFTHQNNVFRRIKLKRQYT